MDGWPEGHCVGVPEGSLDGREEGTEVGSWVGLCVGAMVGKQSVFISISSKPKSLPLASVFWLIMANSYSVCVPEGAPQLT